MYVHARHSPHTLKWNSACQKIVMVVFSCTLEILVPPRLCHSCVSGVASWASHYEKRPFRQEQKWLACRISRRATDESDDIAARHFPKVSLLGWNLGRWLSVDNRSAVVQSLDNATAKTDARTFIQGPGPGTGLRWQGPGQGQGLESQGQGPGPGLKCCP